MTTDSTPTPAEPLKPHQPEEVQMLDMGEFMQAVHVKVNDPEWPEFQAWREAQAKHSNVTPWCAWQERARRAAPAAAAAEIAQPAVPEPAEFSPPVPNFMARIDAYAASYHVDAVAFEGGLKTDTTKGHRDAIERAITKLATQAQPATHAEVMTERQFAEWLNDRRMHDVSSVFHDIVAHYRAAIATQAAQQPKDLGANGQ